MTWVGKLVTVVVLLGVTLSLVHLWTDTLSFAGRLNLTAASACGLLFMLEGLRSNPK